MSPKYAALWRAYLEAERVWCEAGCPDSGKLADAWEAAWLAFHS